MSRVLTVFGGSDTSGAQRMAWRTTAAVAARGHDIAVLTPAAAPDFTAGWVSFPADSTDHEVVGAFRPDVVHGYDLALPVDVARAERLATLANARFVLTPASAPQVWPDKDLGGRLCRRASALYALTNAETAILTALGVDPGRVHRLPSAPDLHGQPDASGFRNRHALKAAFVLFLGRRVADKGYRELLEAAPLVWKRWPDAVFAFAGPYGEPGAAELFAAPRDPRILDLGMVQEQTKHDALAACDVFCLPTRADVFPLVFAEAWSLGRPVVTGRFPGVEQVVHDGVDALVTGHEPQMIAAVLCRLLGEPALRTALGTAGRSRVIAEMGWDRVAEAVVAGYECPT